MIKRRTPHSGRSSRTFTWLFTPAIVLLSLGCGNTVFVFRVNAASNKLEEARELGAERLAPYEFYYAQEHLNKARAEAADADYSDAINFAEASEEYAEKAIRLSREAHRGAGR